MATDYNQGQTEAEQSGMSHATNKVVGENGKISIDGKILREKPGFFKRFIYSQQTALANKMTYTDPALSHFLYETRKYAYSLGLSKEECGKVSQEIGAIIKREDIEIAAITNEKRDMLFRGSATFRGTAEGQAYLDSKFGLHSQQEMKARELADKIITDMPELNIKTPGKTERSSFDMGIVLGTGSSWSRAFIDPKDFALQREAANLAFSLGMSKSDALQVGEEVFKKADGMAATDMNYNLNDLLAQSPTFSTYEQGVQYLQRAKLDMAVDKIHQDNAKLQQAQADYAKAQAANKLRSKYGMGALDTSGMVNNPSVGGLNGAIGTDVSADSSRGISTQGHNAFGDFFSSGLGRVAMAVIGLLLTKMLGGSSVTGLLTGGAGALLSPVLGNLFNGFSSRSVMAQQGIDQLNDLNRREQLAEARERSHAMVTERQQSMTDNRGIQDSATEKQARELTNTELMNVVREKGIDGVHAYFGADEKKFNEFLSRNNLNEVARNESRIRLEGGDWLKATRDFLVSAGASMNTPGEGVNRHLTM